MGGIVTNLIAFGLLLGAIGNFASWGEWLKYSAEKNKKKSSNYAQQIFNLIHP